MKEYGERQTKKKNSVASHFVFVSVNPDDYGSDWKTLTDTVREAMKEVGGAADQNAVQTALSKAKTAVAAIKTDAQLTEEEQKPDDPKPTDSATAEPKPTDSGTAEPKPTDQGTIDPKPTDSGTAEPKPTDSGTTEPKPTDSGTAEPKPTDSGTAVPTPTDPGTTVPEMPVLKAGDSVNIGNLKFVVMDPVQKNVSVEGVASAKTKKFAVNIPSTVVINGSECKVTEVRKKGFAKFAKITKVSLGNNITKVGKNAFDGCKAITSLTVKGDVKTFDSKSFNGCKKLKAITFKGRKVPAFKSEAFKGTASKVKVKLASKMSAKEKSKMKSKLKKAGIKNIK